MKEKLQLCVKSGEKSQEDYDALEMAIVELAGIPEENFGEVKNEDWYRRAFDMVEFAGNGKSCVADCISETEHAQQVLIDMLLIMMESDENISVLVTRHTEDLRKICKQTIWLYSRIKRLENIAVLNTNANMDVRDISSNAKKILCVLLHRLQEEPGRKVPNDLQRAFANAMFGYLGPMDSRIDDPLGALEIFENDPDTKRKMLACCMEYIYLGCCHNGAYDDYDRFIEQFDLTSHDACVIQDLITEMYDYRGMKGLCGKYMQPESDESQITFYAEFEKEED
ncbi:MAG: hypothetical protein LUC95_01745 [Lachnospiraceae bacterium]|nr:hypothetical protein [Lachnospiraceae bacterium]